jgi:hypothetical protein
MRAPICRSVLAIAVHFGQSVRVHLASSDGNTLSLRVSGYQFPNAVDPRRRYSWHMVTGSVGCSEVSWDFEWQALTCDESPRISHWLRAAASAATEGSQLPMPLEFTEPNLRFDCQAAPSGVVVCVWFDLEFHPQPSPRKKTGNPYRVDFQVVAPQLAAAADEWDADIASFPEAMCARCGKPVIRSLDRYDELERMHWVCFHYEFEHAKPDADMPCHDARCPARSAILPRPSRPKE